MNIHYLMQHISYHLHTTVRQFYLPTTFHTDYHLDWFHSHSFCARKEFKDDYLTSELLEQFFQEQYVGLPKIPILLSAQNKIVYSLIPTQNHYFLIGPVRFSFPTPLNFLLPEKPISSTWLDSISICSFSDIISDILLLFNIFQNEPIDYDTLVAFNCINPHFHESIHADCSELIFENRELNLKHNPYSQELREFNSITNGDIAMLKSSLAEDYIGEIGTLANDNLRHMKNRAIVVITLASRAAIRGGLLPELSFSISDVQIQKIEEQTNPDVILNLMHQFEFEYTYLVASLRNKNLKHSIHKEHIKIKQCKEYIFKHLHNKISIQAIAKELNLNPNYLSELFKKQEGITISEFIILEKINLTKNLLIYSSKTYVEIAMYLGFSSQSHLGKQFKKITNMTLKEYRECYGTHES